MPRPIFTSSKQFEDYKRDTVKQLLQLIVERHGVFNGKELRVSTDECYQAIRDLVFAICSSLSKIENNISADMMLSKLSVDFISFRDLKNNTRQTTKQN
ncbi:MAG: hypothetical protein ACI4T5_03285 [Prevotella sp.]